MNLTDTPFLKSIVDSAPIGICIISADTFVVEMLNNRFAEITGKPKSAVLGKGYLETFAPASPSYKALLSKVVTFKETFYGEESEVMIVRNGNLEGIQVKSIYAPILNEDQKLTKIAVWVLETTSRSKEQHKISAEKEPAELERDRFNKFLNQAPEGIAILSGEHLSFELVNSKYQELFPERNLLGRPYFDAIPELRGSDIYDALQKVYDHGVSESFDNHLVSLSANGNGVENRYFTFTFVPRFDQKGSVNGIFAFAYEVTQIRHNNESVKQANNNLAQLVNMVPASVVIIRGHDLIVEEINDANLNYWNKTRKEVIGRPFLEILPDLADQPFAGQLRRVMETGEVIDVKESPVLFTEQNGTIRETYVDYTYQPLSDLHGDTYGVLVMSFEITDRVLSRRLLETYTAQLTATNDELSISNNRLAKSEGRFRFLIKEAPVAIGVLHGEGFVIESANSKILELWGKTEQIIGLPLVIALPEIKEQPFIGLLEKVRTTGEPFQASEIRALLEHKDGLKEIFFNVVYQPIQDLSGNIADILVVAVDVTPQVTARRQVEVSEAHFKKLADLVPAKISNALPSGEVVFFNEKWLQFAGMSFEDLRDFGYHQMMHPDEIPSFQTGLARAAASRNPYVSEMRFKNINGEYIWHLNIASPIFDESGNLMMWVGSTTDIQALKEEDQRKNDFIAMVSHELKTPVTSINAYLQLLQRRAGKNEDTFFKTAVDQSLKQVKQMATLIDGFLNVSRLESGKLHMEKSAFDISEFLREIEDEHQTLHNSHELKFKLAETAMICADRNKLAQVVNNLIGNAIKYSPNDTTIIVSSEIKKGKLRVIVQDEGIGIKAEDIAHLFDRYYRVENSNTIAGFGIGLYLSSEIIKAHGGRIWAESELGEGSRFCFEMKLDTNS
jgi:PAS domain S-box-containing protein